MDVLKSIAIFCRVVEAGSFSAVANEKDMSLSSVSRYQSETSGTLHLNIPVTFGELYIMPALLAFHENYPDMNIDLTMDDREVDLVREGVDLAILIGPLADSSMVAQKIGSVKRVFVASPEYLAKHGEPKTPAELEQHNCVILSSMMAPGEWQYTGPVAKGKRKGKDKVQVSGNLTVNNPAALREAVLAGGGIAAAPVWLVHEGIQQGKLKVILQDYEPVPLDINAVYRKRLYVQQKVVLMIDYLRESFKQTLKKIKV